MITGVLCTKLAFNVIKGIKTYSIYHWNCFSNRLVFHAYNEYIQLGYKKLRRRVTDLGNNEDFLFVLCYGLLLLWCEEGPGLPRVVACDVGVVGVPVLVQVWSQLPVLAHLGMVLKASLPVVVDPREVRLGGEPVMGCTITEISVLILS